MVVDYCVGMPMVATPVDIQGLQDELDAECALELLAAFIDDTAPQLALLSDAVVARDVSKVKSVAHMLKGCCRSIKAQNGEQASAKLEHAAVTGDWSLADEALLDLDSRYGEILDCITDYLETV